MAFFFNLGNFVKESIGYLNVSAKKKKKKKKEENVGSKALVVLIGRATQDLVLMV